MATINLGRVKGDQGISITDAEIDASGHLIVTLSDNTTIDCGLAKGTDFASNIAITDTNNKYTSTNVDGALDEIGLNLEQITNENTMPHVMTNFKTNKKYRYGYRVSASGIPQIISEEVI